MKASMYSKQATLSSRSRSDESLPCTGPMTLVMWNSSSAGSVIRSFQMSHTKFFLVQSAMMDVVVMTYLYYFSYFNTADLTGMFTSHSFSPMLSYFGGYLFFI